MNKKLGKLLWPGLWLYLLVMAGFVAAAALMEYYILAGTEAALLLLVADSVSRVLVTTVSMPIGVVTSLIGVPFFLWLIVRKRQEV